jgi:predicted Zn-dependent peptidase
MSRIASLLIAVLLLVAALPARADLSRPIYEKRLSNGLRVIVCPDPAGTDVSLLVRYEVGSGDEPTSLEGLAHLVEHLMFLGSKHARLRVCEG